MSMEALVHPEPERMLDAALEEKGDTEETPAPSTIGIMKIGPGGELVECFKKEVPPMSMGYSIGLTQKINRFYDMLPKDKSRWRVFVEPIALSTVNLTAKGIVLRETGQMVHKWLPGEPDHKRRGSHHGAANCWWHSRVPRLPSLMHAFVRNTPQTQTHMQGKSFHGGMWDVFHYVRQIAFACVMAGGAVTGMLIRSKGEKTVRGTFSKSTHTLYLGLWAVIGIASVLLLWNVARIAMYFMGVESLTSLL